MAANRPYDKAKDYGPLMSMGKFQSIFNPILSIILYLQTNLITIQVILKTTNQK